MTTRILQIEALSKSYGSLKANDAISLTIKAGGIHALLGENGAGKSTLVKIIYGLIAPDAGQMTFQGQPFAPLSPSEARRLGIGMVFQHFSLFPALSVAENVALGSNLRAKPAALIEKIKHYSAKYHLTLDPNAKIAALSAGERQRVEILRALLQEPQLLIMDEPTSVLTPHEVDKLFATLRDLKAEGRSILYITHKLDEIRKLCDAATILRAGKCVADFDPKTTSAKEMAEMMVGTRVISPQSVSAPIGKTRLRLTDLHLPGHAKKGKKSKGISLDLHAGQILGIGGIAGNGQDALMSALSGEAASTRESIVFDGRPIGNLDPNQRRKLGILTAPEERLGHAAAPEMTLVENAALSAARRKKLVKRGWLQWPRAKAFAQEIIAAFDVRTTGTEQRANALSGGNLQKFLIGRELLQDPEVLIVNQPTWGVDAASAATIRQKLVERAEAGTAIMIISQDLDEIREIATHFAVLSEGALSAVKALKTLSAQEIGLMMGGQP